MDDAFRPQCLTIALRTLDLKPLDVLVSEKRIPCTVDADEGRTARPTWVGKDYQPGGVLLLGKNPGGGSPSFERMRPQWDFAFFDAIKRLRNERSMEAHMHLSDHAQPNAMRQWPMWRSINAVLEALGLDLFSVAMGNLVPFRTTGNKVLAQEFKAAWRLDVAHTIQLLQPNLIVKMTNAFDAFTRYCPSGIAMQQFHRANGDGYITPAGQADLERLRASGVTLVRRATEFPTAFPKLSAPTAPTEFRSMVYNRRSDNRVFVFVRPVEHPEFEKVRGTKGYDRYLKIKRGMTVQEFLSLPMPNNPPRYEDVKYNEKCRPLQRSPNLVLAEADTPQAREARADYIK